MACERHSRPSTQATEAILVATLLAQLQPLSTTQPLRTDHHFPRPHTCTGTHYSFRWKNAWKDRPYLHLRPLPPGQTLPCLCSARCTIESRKRGAAQCTQHGIVKKGGGYLYTCSRTMVDTVLRGAELGGHGKTGEASQFASL